MPASGIAGDLGKEKEMELQVKEYQLPAEIEFNFEDLKKELTEKVQFYETLVYTDDQIKQAKADKAALNKLKKALNDERIRREKEYMMPFEAFKGKVNEIIAIIDKPVAIIDRQVKEYEKKEEEEKRGRIIELFDSLPSKPEWLKVEQIWDTRWLNKSVSLRMIEDNMLGWLGRIGTELATINSLGEGAFEAAEEYKKTLDLGRAVQEGKRIAEIARRKKEWDEEQKKIEQNRNANPLPTVEEDFMPAPAEEKAPVEDADWISFKALLTIPQAKALKKFFEDNGITFKAI